MDKEERVSQLAREAVRLAHDSILVHMRFLDAPLSKLPVKEKSGCGGMYCDGRFLHYDPRFVIERYRREPAFLPRAILHILFHFIFYHAFRYGQVDRESWDLAADMAAEHTVMQLRIPGCGLKSDLSKTKILEELKADGVKLTAEKIYRRLRTDPPDFDERQELSRLFFTDSHEKWEDTEQMTISLAEWKRLAERMKADLKTFSQGKEHTDAVAENLEEATAARIDYRAFLRRFVTSGEAVHINDEEFDYIPYTYGLARYGDMPIVEPLEYKDVNRIRDFVIAIDTSASCRGTLVRRFLKHTYSIMKTADAFFEDMNVHIIQCDHEVRNDTCVRTQEEFDEFLEHGKLEGFGSTDFRPVFAYVQTLAEKGMLGDMRGLIYFTDGHGTYPVKAPDYDTVFVLPDGGDIAVTPPPWAMKVILSEDEMEEHCEYQTGERAY